MCRWALLAAISISGIGCVPGDAQPPQIKVAPTVADVPSTKPATQSKPSPPVTVTIEPEKPTTPPPPVIPKTRPHFEFRGIRCDREPPESFKSRHGFGNLGRFSTTDRVELPGYEKMFIHFDFEEGLLQSVAFSFDSDAFDKLMAVYTERFGKPDSLDYVPVRNRLGAEFMNTSAVWKLHEGKFKIERYGSKLDNGFGMFQTEAELLRARDKSRQKLEDLKSKL